MSETMIAEITAIKVRYKNDRSCPQRNSNFGATLWAAVVRALIGVGIAYSISSKQIRTAHQHGLN